MQIQWFPGHMHKARQQMATTLKRVDGVIELIDARLPFSSKNPMLAELCGDKPCVTVMMKSDLSEPRAMSSWQQFFLEKSAHAHTVITASLTDPQSIRALIAHCRQVFNVLRDRRTRTTMIVAGIPNVGKSSLLNALVGRAIAKTGDQPAITRHTQTIELEDDLLLLDTPGVLWPNIENRNSGFRLAASGAVGDAAISNVEVAEFLVQYLLEAYPRNVVERFELQNMPENEHAALNAIGEKRGCLTSGGQVDLPRTAKLLITEFRSGQLGKICLETPAMIEQELAELAIIQQQKAELRRQRKNKYKKQNQQK